MIQAFRDSIERKGWGGTKVKKILGTERNYTKSLSLDSQSRRLRLLQTLTVCLCVCVNMSYQWCCAHIYIITKPIFMRF